MGRRMPPTSVVNLVNCRLPRALEVLNVETWAPLFLKYYYSGICGTVVIDRVVEC